MSTSGRISVVVPIFDVEPYLHSCLNSIAQQSYDDLRVVMVDDGSTDASAAVAERFAQDDPRFVLVRQANAGLGAARNTGVDNAEGEFLSFVDSDDVLPPNAYALQQQSLQRSGSDFVTGVVRRFGARGTSRTNLTPFSRTVQSTHVTHNPDELLVDRVVTNKLWRRSFWDDEQLRFPEGVLYEDVRVSLSAHVAAKAVDVLRDTVYWWRQRGGATRSITQHRHLAAGVSDRVSAVRDVARLMGDRGLDDLRRRYDAIALSDELRMFVDAADRGDDEYRRRLVDELRDYLDEVDDAALDALGAVDRLKYHLVNAGDTDGLLEALAFERACLRDAATIGRGEDRYAQLPFLDDPGRGVPRRVYRLHNDLHINAQVRDLRWQGEKLIVSGYAYIDRVHAPRRRAVKIWLVVTDPDSGAETVVPARSRTEPAATLDADQAAHCYDGAGFVATLDPQTVVAQEVEDAELPVAVVVEADGVRRRSVEWDAVPALPHRAEQQWLGKGRMARAEVDAGRLSLVIERRWAAVDHVSVDGDAIVVGGPLRIGPRRARALVMRRRVGSASHWEDVDVTTEDEESSKRVWHSRVPVTTLVELIGADVSDDDAAEADRISDGVTWNLRLRLGDRSEVPLVTPPDVLGAAVISAGREFAVQRNRRGHLTLIEREPHVVVTDVEWQDATLRLSGTMACDDTPLEVVLRRRRSGHQHRLSTTVRDGAVNIDIPLAAVAGLGDRPLAEGTWEVIAAPPGATAIQMSATIDDALLARLPMEHEHEGRSYSLQPMGRDSLSVVAAPAPRVSRWAQAQQRERALRRGHRRRLQDVVLFSSWRGRRAAGDVLALHRRLQDVSGPRALWVSDDDRVAVAGADVVRRGDVDHATALTRARWVVTDHLLPAWWEPRDGQRVLQTWHGTPIKRWGLALPDQRAAAAPLWLRELRRQAPAWDLLVSPSTAATVVLRAALGYHGAVVESGSPRLDVHADPEVRARRALGVREQLGISRGARVVLWAPTALDEGWTGRRRRSVDVDLDAQALRSGGQDVVLLAHGHPALTETLDPESAWTDVSGYPDVHELLLAADVLVTDYSSLLLDFLHTGRPVVLHVPDAAEVDLAIDVLSHPPGPLTTTSDEAVAAIAGAHQVAPDHLAAYQRLKEEYAGPADGACAARVLEALLDS